MITSKRTFGVEMECSAGNSGNVSKLRKKLGLAWRFDDDGSIRDIVPFPTEVVSPILRGTNGEKKLREACIAMKDLGFDADHLACGMHVHLGAEDYRQRDIDVVLTQEQYDLFVKNTDNVKDIKQAVYVNDDFVVNYYCLKRNPLTKRYRDIVSMWGFNSNGRIHYDSRGSYYGVTIDETVGGRKLKVLGFLPQDVVDGIKEEKSRANDLKKKILEKEEQIIQLSQGDFSEHLRLRQELDILYLQYSSSRGDSSKQKKELDLVKKGKGRYVLRVVDRERSDRLIRLLMFYLVFDDVFLSMLPCSRRDGNSYCMPLSTSFTRDEVLSCRSQEDFEKLWYKDKDEERIRYHKRDHYDNSRYHNVNFHSLFNRHGTVEIRSHGATINPNKILLWTALHQHILDAVSDGVSIDDLSGVPQDVCIEKLCYRMFDIINLPDYLRKYVMRLSSFYSDAKF